MYTRSTAVQPICVDAAHPTFRLRPLLRRCGHQVSSLCSRAFRRSWLIRLLARDRPAPRVSAEPRTGSASVGSPRRCSPRAARRHDFSAVILAVPPTHTSNPFRYLWGILMEQLRNSRGKDKRGQS